MTEIKITLKRINEKGKIVFEPPKETDLQYALRNVLRLCRDKYNDYVSVTFKPPYKPRTTGKGSQNHHLNGHIMQICNVTGNDYETIKYCIKMTAAEQYGYPVQEVAGHAVPKRECDCDTSECAMLIEASHYLASQLGIILREEAE